jgi:hypothetical protein
VICESGEDLISIDSLDMDLAGVGIQDVESPKPAERARGVEGFDVLEAVLDGHNVAQLGQSEDGLEVLWVLDLLRSAFQQPIVHPVLHSTEHRGHERNDGLHLARRPLKQNFWLVTVG